MLYYTVNSLLVGLQFLDSKGKTLLVTENIDSFYENPRYRTKKVDLYEDERLIGVVAG
jgi:hypothetical protein